MGDDAGVRRAELYALYDAALPEVYGYLLDRCGDRVTAEDLASETFLGAARSLAHHPETPPSIPWLIGIARHKLADHWRRHQRDERAAGATDPNRGLEDPWDGQLEALRAREVLEGLADHHRLALTLRYVDDLPVSEVARILDRSVYGTEALLARARSAYRGRYQRGEDHAH